MTFLRFVLVKNSNSRKKLNDGRRIWSSAPWKLLSNVICLTQKLLIFFFKLYFFAFWELKQLYYLKKNFNKF